MWGGGVDYVTITNNFKLIAKEYLYVEGDKENFFEYLVCADSYTPWGKMYKTDICKILKFREDFLVAEDAAFIREYLIKVKKIAFIKNDFYFYNTSNNMSLSHKGYKLYSWYYEYKLIILRKMLLEHKYEIKEINEFISYRTIHGIVISLRHYYRNFKSEYGELAKYALNLLLPYLTDVSHLGEYKKFYKKYLSKQRNDIVRATNSYFEREERISKLKSNIKKLLFKLRMGE